MVKFLGSIGMEKFLHSGIRKNLRNFSLPAWSVPILLLGLCVAAYALLTPWLKYYWDDNGIIWIYKNYGNEGLLTYNDTKRPVLGMLYTIFTPILGTRPLTWHITILILRWLSGVCFWALLRMVWPTRQRLALWAAVAFTLYPGFDQQPIAVIYSYVFLILIALLLSFSLTLLAIRKPKWFWLAMLLSFLLATFNIITLEYFYTLELLRPILIFVVLQQMGGNSKEKFRKTLLYSLPFLTMLFGITIWRSFFFEYQTYSYDLVLLDSLRDNFWQGLGQLFSAIFRDINSALVRAWIKPFQTFDTSLIDPINLLRNWVLTIFSAFVMFLFFFLYGRKEERSSSVKQSLCILLVASAAIILAGIPYWLIGIAVDVIFPSSRFTLAYLFGVSLFLAGLLDFYPRFRLPAMSILAIVLGFSIGLHFRTGLDYRADGEAHLRMMEELSLRIPGLKPGTIIMANYNPGTHNSDNSLTGPLNYLYAGVGEHEQLQYLFVYPSAREGISFSEYLPGLSYQYDYSVAKFSGNTSNILTIVTHPNRCLRVLHPWLDPHDFLLEEDMRKAASLSNWDTILFDREPYPLPQEIYDRSALSEWCRLYQQAAVAHQQQNWQESIRLYDTALAKGMTFSHPAESMIFIQSYARLDRWEEAQTLTQKVSVEDSRFDHMLCYIWEDIGLESVQNNKILTISQQMLTELGCALGMRTE